MALAAAMRTLGTAACTTTTDIGRALFSRAGLRMTVQIPTDPEASTVICPAVWTKIAMHG
jgi:hypothetical protein